MASESRLAEPRDIGECEGCGKTPEVYGSSWCGACHDSLPRYVKDRIIRLRNACIDARYARTREISNRILEEGLCRPK